MRVSVALLIVVALMAITVMPLHIALAEPPANPTRDLPGTVYRGETFNVTVNFTAPADNFSAPTLTDLAPEGWNVTVNLAWCTPAAAVVNPTGNKAEVIWGGPFSNGTNFVALYKVTVPSDAELGNYNFTGFIGYCFSIPWVPSDYIFENIMGVSQVEVRPPPKANFTAIPTNPCVNTSVNFTDSSTGDITSWSWTFEGGNPPSASTQEPHPVTYSVAGSYNVSLEVGDGYTNDTKTVTGYIVVKPAPIANFTVDNTSLCVNTPILFTDLSTPIGEIDNWTWNFGDGNNSAVQHPTHQYSTAGTYNVSLTVENECGSNTKPNCITVKALPIANFTVDDNTTCVNTSVNFSDNSTGNPTNWTWNFGDGRNSTDPNPSHQYFSAGTYNVSLNVTNKCGSNTTTKINYISVSEEPTANFTAIPTIGYAPLTVNFTDNSTGDPTNWSWDFGDGNTNNTKNPSHTYSTAGTYAVNLTVSNACDNNTATATVTIKHPGGGGGSGGGGGGGGGSSFYLDIDILGKITRVKMSYGTSETLKAAVASDFNNTNFVEIDADTRVICDDTNKPPKVLVMRVANQSPPVPDGSIIIGSVYDFTGNYGYQRLQCCSGVTFDQNITIVLSYDPNDLPESTDSVAVAYYDTEQGSWVTLPTDIGRVAEVGKATGLINHCSAVAVIAELAPTLAPASFVSSALSIAQSPQVWKNIFVGVTGEDITIAANVANSGGQEGTYTAELKLNGERIDAKGVTLAAGQSRQVTFALSGMDYGQYEVEVAGLSGEFTVSQTIDWWSIFGIILAVGLITWGVIRWIRRKKPAQPAESEVTEGTE